MKNIKKVCSLLFVFAICMLISVNVNAEDPYTLIQGSNSMGSAPTISCGKNYVTSLTGSEVLYFKVTTPNKKAFYDYYAKNINVTTHSWSSDAMVQVLLINPFEEIISKHTISYGYDSTKNIELNRSSTYYIKICNKWPSDTPGNIRFSLNYTEDTVADTQSEGTAIALDKTITGSLVGEYDIDYYKFTTSDEKNYSFYAKNINISTHSWSSSSMFRAILHNSVGEKIAELPLTSGAEKTSTVTLQPKTVYYIKIYDPWKTRGNYLFKVSPVRTSIENSDVSHKATVTYTGKKITPSVKVMLNAQILKKSVDYTITYSNNLNPGKATMKIKGIGKYTGTVTRTFNIQPIKQVIKKLSNVKGGKLKITLTKDSKVSGYQIQYSKKLSFKSATTVPVSGYKKVNKTISKLTKNNRYYVRVRSYKIVGTTKITGAWSNPKSIKITK